MWHWGQGTGVLGFAFSWHWGHLTLMVLLMVLDYIAGAMWFQAMVFDHALDEAEARRLVDRILSAF